MLATSLQEQFRGGDRSAVEIIDECLSVIAQRDSEIGAFLEVYEEDARGKARELDERRARGETLGALAGVPVSLKDILCRRGYVTSCASKMLASFRAPYTATVVERLERADAIVVGRTNMDEFAMGGSTENSAFGVTRNPHDLDRVPGGSSGGAAASVAAGMVPIAIGTDTGGSIRQPAAYCGVAGLKPTYGRVSRYGLVAFASSLDQIGPLARSTEDLALALSVIAGHDSRDSTSAPRDVPDYVAACREPLGALRVGVLREQLEHLPGEVRGAVERTAERLAAAGADVVDAGLPHARFGVATYYLVAPSEASSNLARYDGVRYGLRVEPEGVSEGVEGADRLTEMYCRTRSEGFGAEVQRRIMLGTYALSAGYYDAYYLQALKVRRLIQDDYVAAFERCDVLLGPTTPSAAFRIGELKDDPLQLYLQDLFTVTANLAGVPALSIPAGATSEGLPIGVQLQGRFFEEAKLLQAARAIEQ